MDTDLPLDREVTEAGIGCAAVEDDDRYDCAAGAMPRSSVVITSSPARLYVEEIVASRKEISIPAGQRLTSLLMVEAVAGPDRRRSAPCHAGRRRGRG